MSPLTRSLIALAAIFAVAVGESWVNPNCDQGDIGKRGQHDIVLANVTIPCPAGNLDINYWCEAITDPYGRHTWVTCGEHVNACNPYIYGKAPSILVDPDNIFPVHIICNDPYETTATVQITVHCCHE